MTDYRSSSEVGGESLKAARFRRVLVSTAMSTFTHEFNTPAYKGKSSFSTGLYINGKFVEGSDKTYIEFVSAFTLETYSI